MPRSRYFEGARCSAYDSPLDSEGYCTDEDCGYSAFLQEEAGRWRLYEQ